VQEEDKTKVAADLKQWISERITELQAEIERLKEMQSFVDTYLKQSTFKTAIEISQAPGEVPEIRELKRDRTGELIANATITSQTIIVEPVQGLSLKTDTPPFKSFLINKILENMRKSDENLAAAGTIKKGQELKFRIEEKNGIISKIVIENYRDRRRLTEILSTITWTFSRMLEK
jgi:hypothetical protein